MRIQVAAALAALAAPALADPRAAPAPPASSPSSAPAAPRPAATAAIVPPHWLHVPAGQDFASVYPARAQRAGVSGRVVMLCTIEVSGNLAPCTLEEETPLGYGFGDAALKLSRLFRMAPGTRNGQPIVGGTIHIPIEFSAPGAAQPPPGLAAALAFYPAPARAAHVSGEATLRCARNAHLALDDCALVSESPAGQGFGDAALAMAARSPDNPDLNVADAALLAPSPITVRFAWSLPSIDPDLTEMAHVVKRPQVVQQPTPARVMLYYPIKAMDARIGGSVTVHCRVRSDGKLADCTVVKESPTGQNFGAAASLVAEREYRMTPMLYDGKPTDVGEADLTIGFGVK